MNCTSSCGAAGAIFARHTRANRPWSISGGSPAMLAETGLAAAENWTFGDGFVERLRYEIDPQWRGEIPRTMLITRDGATTTIDGAADLDRVRAWLDAQRGVAN